MKQLVLLFFVLFSFSCKMDADRGTGDEPISKEVKDVTFENNSNSTEVEKGRDSWQKPGLILSKMGDLNGQKVADIGAGYGYFTFILANRNAKVIAVDIDNEMLRFIRDIASKESNPAYQENIEYRLVKPENPSLSSGEVDQVLLVNLVGYLDNLSDYIDKLKKGLKSGGQINIVDFKMKRLPESLDIPKDIRVYADQVEDLLYQSGFTEIDVDDTSLDYQYIITAKNP